MDFSLLAPSQDFDFTQYFQPIVDQFAMVGREVEIKKKDKKNFCKVESAFLKDNTDVYDITFQTEKSIKIKIEVDTQPPLKFLTEQKLLLLPQSFMTRCFTLPDLFAGYGGATFGLRRAKINHKVAENGGYPPTQNGDTRSLFLLLSLPSPTLLTS